MKHLIGKPITAQTTKSMDNSEFASLRKPIALVVDDELLILMDHVDMISMVEATTMEQAYFFLEEHLSLQLLFNDVEAPGEIIGFELAKIVAVNWPHIAIVVASGAAYPQPGDLPHGATFMAKPLSQAMVHEAVTEHLKKPQGARGRPPSTSSKMYPTKRHGFSGHNGRYLPSIFNVTESPSFDQSCSSVPPR